MEPRLVVHVVDGADLIHDAQPLLHLVRHLPPERYRQAIVCLDDGAVGFQAQDVDVFRVFKRAGRLPTHYLRLFGMLRSLRPDLVHTRNPGGLWAQAAAALAGVPVRVHTELGRDPYSGARGSGWGARALPRLACPFVDHVIAASAELERWLVESVGVPAARVSHIAHAVDSMQFHPRLGPAAALGPPGFMRDGAFVIGSVGRMDEAAGHATLVEAFLRLIACPHPAHQRLRLLIVGDGPTRASCQTLLERAGAGGRAWLPGARADVAQLMRAMDVFVLPAAGGGERPDVILQAMASGLPVVATSIGAHAELVHPGFTGLLVPIRSVGMLASAIADYTRIPDMAVRHGARARSQVIARHSMPAMARDVLAIYDALMAGQGGLRSPVPNRL